jgi:hypothetical protein
MAAEVRAALAVTRSLRRPASLLLAAAERAERFATAGSALEDLLHAEPDELLRELLASLLSEQSSRSAAQRTVRRRWAEPAPPRRRSSQTDTAGRKAATPHLKLVDDTSGAGRRGGVANDPAAIPLRRGPRARREAAVARLGALRSRVRREAEELTLTDVHSAGPALTGSGDGSHPAGFKHRMMAAARDRRLLGPTGGGAGRADAVDAQPTKPAEWRVSADRRDSLPPRVDAATPSPASTAEASRPNPVARPATSSQPGSPQAHYEPGRRTPPAASAVAARRERLRSDATRFDRPKPDAAASNPQARGELWIPAPIAPRSPKRPAERSDDVLFEEAYRHGLDLT